MVRDAPEIVKILRKEEKQGKLDIIKKNDNFINKNEEKPIFNFNKTESKILNVTSHELRTPIAAIKGYVQMILNKKLGEITKEQKNGLDVVLRNANRLDKLIQDLLDISRLESKKMKFIPEKTDIKGIITEIIETTKHSLDKKNIEIILSIEEGLPKIIIDRDRIKQVFLNLINNSIKFSKRNTKINIIIKNQGNNILFQVKDYGRGVSKDDLDLIFNPFYQVKDKDKKLGGVGLGLPISRGIIIAHGGKIWVESSGVSEKGSIFSFTLPINEIKDVENRFDKLNLFSKQI